MCEHIEGLHIGYTQRIRQLDVDVEAEGACDALFGREEGGAAALIRAFRDEVLQRVLLLLQLFEIVEGVWQRTEVCVYVYETPRRFGVGGELGGEVERCC
jgi:hypothetical protein